MAGRFGHVGLCQLHTKLVMLGSSPCMPVFLVEGSIEVLADDLYGIYLCPFGTEEARTVVATHMMAACLSIRDSAEVERSAV